MRGFAVFNKMINVGNAIGVQLHEYITYLKDDPDTKVIATYLEGIKGGHELIRVAREAAKTKPIIALKVGKSSAGARAAASHTGSLAGDDIILDAAFRQAGIVRVSNADELVDMAAVFSSCPIPKGNRLVIMSEGGGDNSIDGGTMPRSTECRFPSSARKPREIETYSSCGDARSQPH